MGEAVIVMGKAVAIMGSLGVLIGIVLAAASKIFYVYVDPKVLAVDDALPGANCGGCGYPGCSANAGAIVAGDAAPNSCVAAGEDVAEAIAGIMGVVIEAKEADIALPDCTYSLAEAETKFIYDGLNDCRAAVLISGGMKVCGIGCLGLGTCARACPFDAIVMGKNGLPVVNEEKCTGCGTCERVCPKHIIKLSSVTRRILLEYTVDHCTTPCQRACPAGINIRDYIREITLGNYERSIQIIKERNPFPTVIGRICPRPCEQDCRRQFVDEPVAINFLKRFVADYEREVGKRVLPYKAPTTGRRVAVVGGGVQGLSTAFFAARLGHDATVFEATPKMGGLLRTAIARERLPMEILEWDIEGIREMGVAFETEKTMGKDITFASLLGQGFNRVFLASGGWDSRLSRGLVDKGEEAIPGTHLLLDVMKAGKDNKTGLKVTGGAVIVGGGELAVEAAEIMKSLGAGAVHILYRKGQAELPDDKINVDALSKKDITVHFMSAVVKLVGEDSRLISVDVQSLESGKILPIALESLVLSSGRYPEMIFSRRSQGTEDSTDAPMEGGPVQWEGYGPYKKPLFAESVGFFSESDELTDFSAAIKAIGAGRRAAASIHQVLYDIDVFLPDNVVTSRTWVQNVDALDGVPAMPRQVMPVAGEKELAAGAVEVEKGFDETMAKYEAGRCLKCGLICYRNASNADIMENA